jgi:DNA-binding transcriptional ArsR family regulator
MRIETIKSASFSRLLREAAETTRLRILNLLQSCALCVADLQRVLGLSEPMVSRHLARLRFAHLVEVERYGKRRIYRLTEDGSPATIVLRHFLADIRRKEPCLARDCARLRQLLAQRRPGAARAAEGEQT